MDKIKKIQTCIIGIFFLIAGGIYFILGNFKGSDQTKENTVVIENDMLAKTPSDIQTQFNLSAMNESTQVTTNPEQDVNRDLTTMNLIYVHVCGSVETPGVYPLEYDTRLVDAVKAAGGFTKDAAKDSVNQAQTLQDGQRIYIPSLEDIKAGMVIETSSSQNVNENKNDKININKASKEELMTLPGIGEAKADSIIAYRDEHAKFQTIEDIQQIPGIKEAIFSRVKDRITVE